MIKKSVIIFTTGTFNLITPAHIRFLNSAAKLGDQLIVFLDDDERNAKLKPGKTFYSFGERMEILRNLRSVDFIIPFSQNEDINDWLQEFEGFPTPPSFLFVKGADYDLSKIDPEIKKCLNERNIPIAFLPYHEGYSTTNLVKKIREEE